MILTGKDAVRFHEELAASKDKKISKEELERIKKVKDEILAKSKKAGHLPNDYIVDNYKIVSYGESDN